MKAHEETWEYEFSTGLVLDGNSRDVVAENTTRADRLVLAAAAPDMAKALLAFLPCVGEHTFECGVPPHGCTAECRSARAALMKAGIL